MSDGHATYFGQLQPHILPEGDGEFARTQTGDNSAETDPTLMAVGWTSEPEQQGGGHNYKFRRDLITRIDKVIQNFREQKVGKIEALTRPSELPKKLTLASKLDRQQLMTTQPRLTSLMFNNNLLNDGVNMQPSWLELAMSRPLQGNETEMNTSNTNKEKPDKEGQKMVKQGGSYANFKDSSQGSIGIETQLSLLTQMMIQLQQEEKGSQTRRNVYISCNYHDTQLRPMHRTMKLMKTKRRWGKSRIFQWDITFAEQDIQCSSTAPQGFPDSEWRHIFCGEAINFDVILSNLHHVAPPKENVGCIGRTEISLGSTDLARKVQTSGNWTATWNATVKATTYAFPHQDSELWQWGDYLSSEFSARQTSAHHKLIAFDKAVRTWVGGRQAILLTDCNEFTYLYLAFLLPDGIQMGSVGWQGDNERRTKSASTDICRRFNSANGCWSPAGTCHFCHACFICKQSGHGKENCPQQTWSDIWDMPKIPPVQWWRRRGYALWITPMPCGLDWMS